MKVEVKEAQSNEVDWTKNPQLVTYNGTIVLTSVNQNCDSIHANFNGIDLSDGEYNETWCKRLFKQFHGEITLKND